MKNKKILAIALAAAMAVTAVLPGAGALTADAASYGKNNVKISSTLCTTEGMAKINAGTGFEGTATVDGSATETLKVGVTTDKSGFDVEATTDGSTLVIAFASGMDGATLKLEGNDPWTAESDSDILDGYQLINKDTAGSFEIGLPNADGTETVYLYVGYADGFENEENAFKSLEGKKPGDDVTGFKKYKFTYKVSKSESKSGSSGGSSSGNAKTSTTTLPDGSKQVTQVVTTATGTITTVTTTKPDGSKTIVKTVKNKDGSGSVTETTITKAGTEKTVEIVMDKTGAVVEVTTSVSNAKGVSAKMSYTASGSKLTLKSVETKGKTAVSIPATVKCDGKTYKVTKIGASALKGNKEIKKVTVGKNVTAIGKNAFNGDSKLKTVVLKGKVTSVGKNAFKNVYKKATFKIAKANFKTVKKAIKKSGVAKTVKYKKA